MLEDKIKSRRIKISEDEVKDDVIKHYDSVIREGSLLTTVCGFLFGFLLNISINTPKGFAKDSIIVLVALYSISFAVHFLLCLSYIIIYSIRIEIYRNLRLRAHRFMRFGIAPAGLYIVFGIGLGNEVQFTFRSYIITY